jgi:hypothetical protein
MIMHLDTMFQSKYFKASDLPPGGLPVRIESVAPELIGQGQDQKEKVIVRFTRQKQALVLNKTNAFAIADILGEKDTNNWPGHVSLLVPDKTMFGASVTDCVRVRKYHKPSAVAAKPPPTEINPPPSESIPDDMDDKIPW